MDTYNGIKYTGDTRIHVADVWRGFQYGLKTYLYLQVNVLSSGHLVDSQQSYRYRSLGFEQFYWHPSTRGSKLAFPSQRRARRGMAMGWVYKETSLLHLRHIKYDQVKNMTSLASQPHTLNTHNMIGHDLLRPAEDVRYAMPWFSIAGGRRGRG